MKVLVVGLGSMGKRRIRILNLLFDGDKCEIVGVDSQDTRRDEVHSLYQVKTYPSISKAAQSEKFDCGFICTSPRYHDEIALSLLGLGIPVFSEINLVNDFHTEIIQKLKETGLKYFLSSTPLYSEDRRYIQEYLQGETDLTYCYHVGQYLPDWHPWESYQNFFVGDVTTNACREIMIIEFPWLIRVFGEIESIHVQKKKNTSLEISYPDTYIMSVSHKSGAMGSICIDVVSRVPVRELTAFNENCYLTWGGNINSIKTLDVGNKQLVPVDIRANEIRDEKYAQFINEASYMEEVRAFFDYLQHNAPPAHTLEQDIQIIEIVNKIEDGGI